MKCSLNGRYIVLNWNWLLFTQSCSLVLYGPRNGQCNIFITMSWSESRCRCNSFRARIITALAVVFLFQSATIVGCNAAKCSAARTSINVLGLSFFLWASYYDKHKNKRTTRRCWRRSTTERKRSENTIFVRPEIERACTASHKMSAVLRSSRSVLWSQCVWSIRKIGEFTFQCVFIRVWYSCIYFIYITLRENAKRVLVTWVSAPQWILMNNSECFRVRLFSKCLQNDSVTNAKASNIFVNIPWVISAYQIEIELCLFVAFLTHWHFHIQICLFNI